MAKFKTNYSRKSGKGSDAIVKVGLFAAIVGGLFYIFNLFTGNNTPATSESSDNYVAEAYYLPTSTTGQLVSRRYYSLSYNEDHEQAEWVAYVLKKEQLDMPWEERSDEFLPDPSVKTGSATPDDYRNSGYDRGHLVPAADMAFNKEALQETFYMSNISPQARNFNKGVWRELEELTRDWARKNKQLYVVTGPVLSETPKSTIGDNEVSVPAAYFKVLLDLTEPEVKAIAFVLPNEISYEPLFKFATSVDKVEALTQIDFFPELMPDDLEDQLESTFNIDLWEFNKKRYDLRIQKWNKQQ
ncbi:MAG: DNA/RNA non-specific endonuclease [Saprospiraceae bacterium]|jgi:endonuclease G|nr:DNA/RNA non-specific endonuclease [Saprospiraceae bacterium]